MKPFSLISFYDKAEPSAYIKEGYFPAFATFKNTNGKYANNYNSDDKRFWDCQIWDKYFAK